MMCDFDLSGSLPICTRRPPFKKVCLSDLYKLREGTGDIAAAGPDLPPPSLLQVLCTHPQVPRASFPSACTHSLLGVFPWATVAALSVWRAGSAWDIAPHQRWPMARERWLQDFKRKAPSYHGMLQSDPPGSC